MIKDQGLHVPQLWLATLCPTQWDPQELNLDEKTGRNRVERHMVVRACSQRSCSGAFAISAISANFCPYNF